MFGLNDSDLRFVSCLYLFSIQLVVVIVIPEKNHKNSRSVQFLLLSVVYYSVSEVCCNCIAGGIVVIVLYFCVNSGE